MAIALRDWLPNIIQSVEPWMSESDIDIGSRWGQNLDKELEKSNFGILCLTPENVSSTWIHYEAGALSKFVDKSRVCPYLLGFQPTDIKGPLVNFQMAKANKDDTLRLVQTINRAVPDSPLSDERISTIFEKFWQDLETALSNIPPETQELTESSRSAEDMVEEILKTVREQSSHTDDIVDRLQILEKLIDLSSEQRDSDKKVGYWVFLDKERNVITPDKFNQEMADSLRNSWISLKRKIEVTKNSDDPS